MYAMYFIFLFCFNWPNIYVGSLIEKKKTKQDLLVYIMINFVVNWKI